ncbi:MAG: hypothetical protein A2Y38_07125 [Spirochaetes bacterium GWB1_59_5]|nr:MAG: hypothetical protein A2Y38_07125 [Spirochaetes bacterium GWB1_59_5]
MTNAVALSVRKRQMLAAIEQALRTASDIDLPSCHHVNVVFRMHRPSGQLASIKIGIELEDDLPTRPNRNGNA